MKNFFTIVLLLLANLAFSQYKINTVGTINISKVLEETNKNSDEVRNFELEKSKYQKELTDHINELKDLERKREEALLKDDKNAVNDLDEQIRNKQKFIVDFRTYKTNLLKEMEEKLTKSDEFYIKMMKAIKSISEKKGLLAILSVNDSNLVWWSDEVEITKDVISCINQGSC